MQIALTPKQKKLLHILENSNYEWVGYGGARGGAKSHAIRELAVYLAFKYNIQILIFRKFRDDLLKNHVYPLLKAHPELRQHFNKTEMVIYNADRNPVIKFDYAETEDEIEKVGQGTEYQITFIDEATQISQKMIEYLSTCTRDSQSLLPTRAKVVCTMNPGGIGHAFIKRIFIDKTYQENEKPGSYAFIQAHVWDNVFWVLGELRRQGYTIFDYYNNWTEEKRVSFTLEHSDYAQRLAGLPEDLKKAHLFGDWEIFGGMFFKNLNLKNQIIEPFVIDPNWKLIGSVDPGYSSPCSFGLMAEDYKGTIHRIYTYYEAGRNPIDHADAIKDLLTSKDSVLYPILNGRTPRLIVSGKDAWAKQDRYAILANDLTFADVFSSKGLYLTPAVTDRVAGWWAWKSYIPDRFLIFNNFNKPLIEQMTAVVTDKRNVEDIEGRGNDPNVEDHSLDECRYGIMSLYKPRPIPKDTRPQWLKDQDKKLKDYSASAV
jgi:phage terminase large subunit